ncbi:putative Holliday junction resolvase, partial [Yersinia pestis PY-100]|jgi:hypothetical protein
MALN